MQENPIHEYTSKSRLPTARQRNVILMAGKIEIWLGSFHSGKSATIRESNHGSGVCKEHYAKYYAPKSSILLAGTGIWKVSTTACGFSSINFKIDYSDYLKTLNSRINEVYAFFFQ